jgi:hypothetical protein
MPEVREIIAQFPGVPAGPYTIIADAGVTGQYRQCLQPYIASPILEDYLLSQQLQYLKIERRPAAEERLGMKMKDIVFEKRLYEKGRKTRQEIQSAQYFIGPKRHLIAAEVKINVAAIDRKVGPVGIERHEVAHTAKLSLGP